MLEKTPVYKLLMNAKLLNDAMAWFEVFAKNRDIKNEIVRLIEQVQLYEEGVDGNNSIIGTYSPLTEELSQGRKKAGTHYTLFDSGDFYKSMTVTSFIDTLLINGNSSKFEDRKWFRNEIYKLTPENLTLVIEMAKIKYIEYARRVLFEGR